MMAVGGNRRLGQKSRAADLHRGSVLRADRSERCVSRGAVPALRARASPHAPARARYCRFFSRSRISVSRTTSAGGAAGASSSCGSAGSSA